MKNMANVHKICNSQRSCGTATILAIGTATPPNCVNQADYPDYYFRITNCDHMTHLKQKFKRMCEKSMIKKSYIHLTEEFLKENPNMCTDMAPSLDVRQDLTVVEVPKLVKEAAVEAIKEWGRPETEITHLIFYTSCCVDMPGADYQLIKLLGLRPSVRRLMMYQQGCYAGGTVLRVAKDLAENNRGARILVVCSEITAVCFHGPSDTHLGALIGQALFGDGAAAMIIGAEPDTSVERPIFQLVSAAQTLLPDSERAVEGHLREAGLMVQLLKTLPGIISENIQRCLVEAMTPIGIDDWNSIFWVVHPGGWAILDKVEASLGLKEKKLQTTRHILTEYGNMWSTSVLFVLDEMRIEEEVVEGRKSNHRRRTRMGSLVRVWAGCNGGDDSVAQCSGGGRSLIGHD